MRVRCLVFLALLSISIAGCADGRPLSSQAPQACRANALPMARLELLFCTQRAEGPSISEEEWTSLLDEEVTPRFPDGLTVLNGYGQWRGSSGAIAKEHSRMLLTLYRSTVESEADIEAIRSAYKLRFGQESVLRVDGASRVSF